jgi:DNA-binding MarR family transcriptional regulator
MRQSKTGQFGALLVSITRAVARAERDRVCCGDLTFQQFQTLSRLEQAPLATIKALATDLAIDESTASRNVSLLVREGYVAKRRAKDDGRAVRLVLTSRGRTALDALQCGQKEVLSGVFDRVPAAERAPAIRALRVVEWALTGEDALWCAPPGQRGASKTR